MIDFEPSEEQQMIRDTIAAFARQEIRPAARPADESCAIPAELVAKAWQLGLVRGPIPEKFGGDGGERSAVTGAIVAEELGYGDMAIALHLLAPRLLAYPILEMGTDAQRDAHLRRFTGAQYVAAASALIEPRFDFEPSALRTTVHREGTSFVISGSKCLVPLAKESETMLVFAATDANAGLAGVDAFIVATKAPGLTISDREKNMGLKALASYQVEFNDCRLEAEARLGGDKGANFSRLMSEARVAIAAMATGMMNGAYEYARDYAKERKAFGVPIATKQAIAFMLADMAIEIDASRLLVWEAASHLDKGEDALKESYLAKNYVAASALKVADNALQALGGHGYIREHPVEMWLRNARGLASLDGIATV